MKRGIYLLTVLFKINQLNNLYGNSVNVTCENEPSRGGFYSYRRTKILQAMRKSRKNLKLYILFLLVDI